MFMLQGELLPADKRGLGMGMLGLIDNVSLFVSVKMVPTLTSQLGMHGTFWMCSSVSFCVVAFSFFLMPETHGKTLEEIESFYRGETKELRKMQSES